MNTSPTLWELTEKAMQDVATYRSPDLDEWVKAIDPLLALMDQPTIVGDRVTHIGVRGDQLVIETSFSLRCCPMTNDMELPLSLVQAKHPENAAKKSVLLTEMAAIEEVIAQKKQYLAELPRVMASLPGQIADKQAQKAALLAQCQDLDATL